jgi:hypothetical protein
VVVVDCISQVSRKKLKPSSGLAGLVLALHTCDMPVSLYGFRHNATTFHYFDKLPTKVRPYAQRRHRENVGWAVAC